MTSGRAVAGEGAAALCATALSNGRIISRLAIFEMPSDAMGPGPPRGGSHRLYRMRKYFNKTVDIKIVVIIFVV